MSYLFYCVVDGDRPEPRRKLRLLEYPRASIAVRVARLGAVVSETSAADLAPDAARLLAYAKVVEWYNEERTVIPMRYGSTLRRLEEVGQFLERRRANYLRMLADVDGRVEMSVRVGVDEAFSLAQLESDSAPSLARLAGGDSAGPGTAYMARRSEYYARRAGFDAQSEAIRRHICKEARGTFVRWAGDFSERRGNRAFALHFLVQRAMIRRFTQALEASRVCAGVALTVTGPWPPYNFVCPATTSATA